MEKNETVSKTYTNKHTFFLSLTYTAVAFSAFLRRYLYLLFPYVLLRLIRKNSSNYFIDLVRCSVASKVLTNSF